MAHLATRKELTSLYRNIPLFSSPNRKKITALADGQSFARRRPALIIETPCGGAIIVSSVKYADSCIIAQDDGKANASITT